MAMWQRKILVGRHIGAYITQNATPTRTVQLEIRVYYANND